MVLDRSVQLYFSDKRTVGTASPEGLRNCAHFGVQPPASMHADSCRILRFFDVWCLISQPHANCWGFFRIEIVQHELTVFRSPVKYIRFRQVRIWSAPYSRILHVLFAGQILHKQLLNLLKSTVCKSTPSFLDTALAGKCALCSTHVLKSVPEHTPYTTNTLTLISHPVCNIRMH